MEENVEEKDSVEDLKDPLLSELITANAEMQEGNLEITLFVGGCVISGELTSTGEYFKKALPKVAVAMSGKGFDLESESMDVQYIHLLNAQVIVPGQEAMSENQGLTWRGKLASVDGFTIGRVKARVYI